MKIEQMNFPVEPIKLKPLFSHARDMGYSVPGLVSEKVKAVYGDFLFSNESSDRPLTYASYVMSIDGKIAFMDDEVGPLIARNNYLDPDGGFADFWVLNLLRAACDAIIIGSGTMIKEPTYSGSAYDSDLLSDRLKNNMSVAPLTVVVTRSGANIPYQNQVFHTDDIPILINTSPNGLKTLLDEITLDYVLMDEDVLRQENLEPFFKENQKKVMLLVTGEENETDADLLLQVLKRMGINKVLVESPTYCHHLMAEELLDEIFINTSCIFVGGEATAIGSFAEAFTSTCHPHAEIVSMHLHSPHFFYTRYKMRYDSNQEK